MKINYTTIARSLIALLFVVAGVQKIMGFSGIVSYIGSLGVPLPALAAALVIIVEVPVALAFAWGYRTCISGWILIGFTIIATILVHHNIGAGVNLIMVLKNIAIIGGIMLALDTCCCGMCPGSKKTGHHGHSH